MSHFHIITPCSRPNNLHLIKKNILETQRQRNQSIHWHICFDAGKTSDNERIATRNAIKENWMFFYMSANFSANSGNSQRNFVLQHLKLNDFPQGFIYVLDDDNLLPINFFQYNYEESESKIYLFPQLRENTVRQPKLEMDQIDQAQFMIHSTIEHLYPLKYNADGHVIINLCKNHPYKELKKPIVFYNRLGKT